MSRIQSSVGLITGIPIEETVNKLMQVAAQPKNLLSNRTKLLESEKLAVTQLSSLLVALQFETNQLGKESLFQSKQVGSSNAAALSATLVAGANPSVGNYLFTPVQTAASQQFLSQSFAPSDAIGAGTFTFRTGGFVDSSRSLDELNGGAGVQRGRIRVTDRSGASAIVDLSFARNVDDVLRAISNDSTINVTAVANGDAIQLFDNSGGSGNLSVQNVSGGTTATDLGLAGISVSASTATGGDLFTLHAQSKLLTLNDGLGVHLLDGASDLQVTTADGSITAIDLGDAKTLGDAISAINGAAPTRLSVAISPDGRRLELTDLTSGSGTLEVSSLGGGTTAEDLGLTSAAVGNKITGRRLASGLKDTLLTGLHGGQGLGSLGTINITNRSGAVSTVNLAGAETVDDLIDLINSQAVGIAAEINAQRSGILLRDTTGGTTSNLIVADGDANNTATKLGLVASVATTTIDGGALRRQSVSEATLLSSLNGGAGIDVGDFKITDSAGNLGAVDLDQTDNQATTIGDVIRSINALTGVQVEARINDNGDGIVLVDKAGGTGTMTVQEVGNGTTAKDLRIVGSAVEVDLEGTPAQVIDGTTATTVTIDEDDTLADVVKTINDLNRGVTASLLNDGTGQRLSLTVDQSGEGNAIVIDAADSSLALNEIRRAQDAIMLYGAADSPGAGVLLTSPSNDFKNVVDGVNLTVNEGTLDPVTVSVETSSTDVVKAFSEFVDAFNSIREKLDELTAFNSEDQTTGILFGTREALRVESDLTQLLTSRFVGVGDLDSLEAIGISFDEKGKMVLDGERLTAAFNDDPDALQRMFTDETFGVAKKLDAVIEQLAGKEHSTLSLRTETLTRNITTNTDRLESMDERLALQRERLLLQFYHLETLVAEMRKGLAALSSLQIIPPLTSTKS